MKQIRYALAGALTVLAMFHAHAQAPGIEWKNVYPHITYTEYGSCLEPTADGGYIVGAVSASNAWIFKLDAQGAQEWDNYIPNDTTTGLTTVYAIGQTADHGYIVAGSDFLTSGTDSIGNHGIRDFLVMKLQENGDIDWIKAYGGSSNEEASAIAQTPDGGYIVAGYTFSSDGDASGNTPPWYSDYWVVKLDASGNIAWQNSYGGSNYDNATSVVPTADGGYIVAGYSGSKDSDVAGTHWGGSDDDVWVVKLDASGTITWQNSYGGSQTDQAYAIRQTADGGYIVAGTTASHDGNVSGNHNTDYNKKDFWVIRLDAAGALTWQKCLGGTGDDIAYSIKQTTDGGYVVGGTVEPTDAAGVDITGYHGNAGTDYWVVRLEASGAIAWEKCLGGQGAEDARSVAETADGGYIVAGTEHSSDGDVAYTDDVLFGHTWVVKLGGGAGIAEMTAPGSPDVYPNPANELVTIDGISPGAALCILDVTGKTVYRSENTGDQLIIDARGLASGVYVVRVAGSGQASARKFTVHH